MAGLAQSAVRVEGLASLRRDFARAGKEQRKAFGAAIKTVAAGVAETAKSIARREDLFESGQLIDKIKPAVKGTVGLIRATATNDGFAYPGLYEFGGRARLFLQPALEQDEDEIVKELDQALGDLLASVNLD